MVSSIALSRRPAVGELTVLFDADCGLCSWSVIQLARIDRRRRLRLVDLNRATLPGQPSRADLVSSMHTVDVHGRWSSGGDACIAIAHHIPALWPLTILAKLPLGRRLIGLGYLVIARHRQRLSRMLGLSACRVPAILAPDE